METETETPELVRSRFGDNPVISVEEEEEEAEEEEAACRSLFLFFAPLPVLSEYTHGSAILEQLPHVGCWRSHFTFRRRHEWQEYEALLR